MDGMGNTSGRKTQKPRPGLVAPCALGYTESKGRLVKSPTLELGTNAKQEARSWTNLVKDNFAKENSTSMTAGHLTSPGSSTSTTLGKDNLRRKIRHLQFAGLE